MLYLRVSCILLIMLLRCLHANTQSIRIGIIDVYGNRTISADSIRHTAGITEGDTVSQRLLAGRQIEQRLEKLPGVKQAQTALVCCDNNRRYVLFIGVAESDSAVYSLRKAPNLKIKLPNAYTKAYQLFSQRHNKAVISGEATDDWSQGYAMMEYAPARRIQEKFLRWANADFDGIKKVMRSSAFHNQRAAAAHILSYHDDKSKVIPELIYALRDEDDEVRNNAGRALSDLSYYMTKNPGNVSVPFQPFIRMINSVSWSDRTKGLRVLAQLSETRNDELFRQLRATSMESLKEMALWRSESHAAPAVVILGRMAGWTDEKIRTAITDENIAKEAQNLVDTVQ